MSALWLPQTTDVARSLRGINDLQGKEGRAIDWSNPITRGLVHVSVFGDTGKAQQYVGNGRVANCESPIVADGIVGKHLYKPSSATNEIRHSPPVSPSGDMTVMVRIKLDSLSADGTIVGQRDGTSSVWQMYRDDSDFFWRAGGGFDRFSSTTANAGDWTTIAFGHTGSTARSYVDGVFVESNATGSLGDFTVPISVGHRWATYPSVGFELSGLAIKYLYIWHRRLTQSELLPLAKDEYQIFAPDIAPAVIAGLPLGGGAVSLTVQSAAHGHTVDSPSLVQASTLAVSDAAHGHTADAPNLVQANTLAAEDATHAHTVDNVVLALANILAPADALHSHTADNIALTQAHTLAVMDASHAHAVDGVTLTTGNTLDTADALHGHLAETPSLVQANTLAVSESTHSHAADSPELVQAGTLSVADSTHQHAAENVSLDVSVTIAVDDSAHSHTAETLALVQANLLAVQSALHAHAADNLDLSQEITLVVSDALHAHLADNIGVVLGDIVTPNGRIFLIPADRRIFVIN